MASGDRAADPRLSPNALVAVAQQDYLAAVFDGDRRRAVGEVLALFESGMLPENIINDVLVGAQRAVGRGWQEGRWSVALEHRATAITESALQTLVDTAMRSPGVPEEGSAGRAVVACSEGEWHVLPGLMAAGVLRLRGADVSFIGPSVPAHELAVFLGVDPPSAVAVTCAMPMSLFGSWRTISALREVGMTVVCGGRGFGAHGRWVAPIGGDVWAPSFTIGADLLLAAIDGARPESRQPGGIPAAAVEVRRINRDHPAIVESSLALAVEQWPHLTSEDRLINTAREDLDETLRAVTSAALISDTALISEYVRWFESARAPRDVPVAFLASAFDLLLQTLPPQAHWTRAMVKAGRADCRLPALPASWQG